MLAAKPSTPTRAPPTPSMEPVGCDATPPVKAAVVADWVCELISAVLGGWPPTELEAVKLAPAALDVGCKSESVSTAVAAADVAPEEGVSVVRKPAMTPPGNPALLDNIITSPFVAVSKCCENGDWNAASVSSAAEKLRNAGSVSREAISAVRETSFPEYHWDIEGLRAGV